MTSIGNYAFENCSGLTSVTIPNSVTSIGGYAFYGCTLTIYNADSFIYLPISYSGEYEIPDGIKKICDYAFSGCSGLTSVTIPNSVTSIGQYVFYRCKNLKNITIGNNVSSISGSAFEGCNGNFYVDKNHISLFTLLKESDFWGRIYDTQTHESIPIKKIGPTIVSITQMGDSVDVVQLKIVLNNVEGTTELTGLKPNTTVRLNISADYKDNQGKTYKLNIDKTLSTNSLSLTTLQPRVATPGNVVVAAESNINNDGENVGFEWRRTDWTDDFASNTGGAYLFEGNMEGYIRNLNTEKLWKYRPYYESNSGKRYYGEWVGLDPTDTSYFEPTVHTYAKVNVQGNSAEVKGYAMRGSDNVTSQGFMYWKASSGARAEVGSSNVTVPKDATTVEVKGNVMTTTLEGLDYKSTYCYVAFVTTSEGETFYGEQQTFKTGENTSGIETYTAKANDSRTLIYDIKGRRLDAPQRGINIIRMSNGTTKKVIVK